jgi:hypothetical protein
MNLLVTGGNVAAPAFWERLGWSRMDVSAWGKDL